MTKSITGARPLSAARRLQRFLRVGWDFIVIYLGYKSIQWRRWLTEGERDAAYARQHMRSARRVYRLATHMEGLLIKACQFISSRADVAPTEYISVLSRLQDQVPPHPYSQIARQVERELGAPPDEVFAAFSREPVASASLAQVHRATTRDGQEVAVKVQYPGIARVVETDLRNLSILVRALALIERKFDFRVLLEEMKRNVPRELDFVLEGRSAERVAANLSHRRNVKIPEVIWEHTARRVLTMEFVEGTKISETEALLAQGIDLNDVAQLMMEAYCEQILVNGFFHADPHPGNLLVQPGPTVVFLDFGLSKELPDDFRVNYAKLTMAIFTRDDDTTVEAFRALGFKTKTDNPETLKALGRSFFESAGPEARPYTDKDVMPEVNERLSRILSDNPVTNIPPDVLLIFRVLGLMSGLQKRLDSRVDMTATITPYAESQAAAPAARVQGVAGIK